MCVRWSAFTLGVCFFSSASTGPERRTSSGVERRISGPRADKNTSGGRMRAWCVVSALIGDKM